MLRVSRMTAQEREDAFEVLFRATYARVLSYARAMAEVHDADDAVAEAYAIAWRRFDDLPPDAELGWLIGATRRVLANARRGRRRADALLELVGAQPRLAGPDPADRIDDDALRTALLTLRAVDREALALVAWADLTPADAAVALGIRAATFRMRLARARRRLRAALDGREERLMTSKEERQCHPS
jgi:RNA polymerase sigma factor (sigma-70 family)